MATPEFVHLHVHTEYSLLDGLSQVRRLVQRAKALDMRALAITDHGTMYGVMDFYKVCRAEGINPIIGVESYLAPRGMTDRNPHEDRTPFHLLLLARNRAGYQNLLKIASAAQLEGFYGKPRIDKAFLAAHAEGLTVTTGCLAAQIPQMLMNGREDDARREIGWYSDVFGAENVYLEIQHHDIEELREVNTWLRAYRASQHTPVRLLATNDVHYVLEDDYEPHDTMLCIQTGALKADAKRMRMSDNSYFLATAQQMWANLVGGLDEELAREAMHSTLLVAEQCHLDLKRDSYHLPAFPVPPGHDARSYLQHLVETGLVWRYGAGAHADAVVVERAMHELNIIHTMGFDTYFLVVWDLCQYARHADIWFNVRGSGAGSLVAYCLGITSIDPLANNLLFERFLNPARMTMPDIDMDFPDDRRAEMIAYTARKYGHDRVAAIITFGTLGAKAAIRDVGRALDVPLEKVNKAASFIPTEAKQKRIEEYVAASPDLSRMVRDDDDIRRVVETAKLLQGVNRHASTHAAGVIVADKPLREYVPLHRLTGSAANDPDNALTQVTQFDMNICEEIGLLKVDFLGLSTIAIMRRACELVAAGHGHRWSMHNIPYRPFTGGTLSEDEQQQNTMLVRAFELISRGDTVGVFQLESPGMQQMLRGTGTADDPGMRPTRFEHIVAAVSLYRPGPMDYIPAYNARLHGLTEPKYHHPALVPILEETYGIMVYQEQLMQVAQHLFGYSLAEADLMRRAVSKKKEKDLLEHRAIFLERGPQNGIDAATAALIFEDIVTFANYGFNKSHAADYAVLTVQTAFLKANYPAEYMAALLSVQRDDSAKVSTLLEACRRMGLRVLPPDVNTSGLDYSITREAADGTAAIRFGLAAVKNVGDGAAKLLIEARAKDGPFADLSDLCKRVHLGHVGKRALECLIKVGALDAFGDRQALLASLDRIVSLSAEMHHAADAGQQSLFGEGSTASADMLSRHTTTVASSEKTDDQKKTTARDMLDWERELLGFYITRHPIMDVLDQLDKTTLTHIGQLTDEDAAHNYPQDRSARMVVLLTALREVQTRKGDWMAALTLEDTYGAVEAVMFPRTWEAHKALVREHINGVVSVRGKVDRKRGTVQIVVDGISTDFDVYTSSGSSRAPRAQPEPPYATHTSPVADAPRPEDIADHLPTTEDTEDKYPWRRATSAPNGPPQTLKVHLHSDGDDEADKRRFDRIVQEAFGYPGHDVVEVIVRRPSGTLRITLPNTARICPELEARLAHVVGPDNIKVRRSA